MRVHRTRAKHYAADAYEILPANEAAEKWRASKGADGRYRPDGADQDQEDEAAMPDDGQPEGFGDDVAQMLESERMAARLLDERNQRMRDMIDGDDDDGSGSSVRPLRLGGMYYGDGGGNGGGDFVFEEPPTDSPQVTQDRISVTLPVSIIVFYDWALNNWWRSGKATLDDFIEDLVIDHITNCWGKRIAVVDTREVRPNGGDWQGSSGAAAAGDE